MPDVMMSFGKFKFKVDGAAYDNFRRSTTYRWPAQDRINNQQALQFLGQGEETISLSGFFAPQYTGRYGIMDDLRELAGQGKPSLLVGGRGDVFGYFVVERVDDGATIFFQQGVPRKVDFTVELRKYGDK